MSIVEFYGPPYWALDASETCETGESTLPSKPSLHANNTCMHTSKEGQQKALGDVNGVNKSVAIS